MNLTTEVLLCTYNGSKFIEEQLKSILNQSKKATKISIYDDHSSDNTVEIIQRFIHALPSNEQRLFNVQINPVNLGYAKNFCSAITQATEDILFLCDQDDVWETKKIAFLTALLIQHEVDMVFSDGSLIDQDDRTIGKHTVLETYGLNQKQIDEFHEHAFESLIKRNYINGAAIAIRRAVAQNALPLPCDMPHDYWLGIWCALHGKIIATPQRLYKYRQHEGNVIGIGSGSPLRFWLNIWRYSDKPREREARIWRAVTERISILSCKEKIQMADDKLKWLSRVVLKKDPSWKRCGFILLSIINGDYKRFSPKYALFRDFFSLLKQISLDFSL